MPEQEPPEHEEEPEPPWGPDAMAELDREIAANNRWWTRGALRPDPATGRTPHLPIRTAAGEGTLDLDDPRTPTSFTVTRGELAKRGRGMVEGDPSIAAGEDWCLLADLYPFRWWFAGALITSAPLSAPGERLTPGLEAVGSSGESLALENAEGTQRWLLHPNFGYKLARDRDGRSWVVSEMAGWGDAEFEALRDEPG